MKVVLEADDRTKAGTESASANLDKFGSVAKKVGGVIALAFAADKILDYGKKSVEGLMMAERSQRQLEHAVIAVSKGTMEQVTAVTELSNALEKKSGIDAEALKAGVAQLSTFGLQSDTVVQLTKSLADLTVNQNGVNASSDQYIQSANMMAKVLNGQFGVLEKSGIRFSELQQQMIMYGTEAERITAIQEGLNQNLRETTDTIGSSAEGAVARFTMAMGEIEDAVGGIILPVLTQLAEAFVPIAQAMSGMISTVGGVGQLSEALTNLLNQLDAQTGLVTLFKDSWANLVFVYNEQLKPALAELWAALQPLKPFLEALVQVLGTMLVIAIGGLILILGSLAIALTAIITQVVKWGTAIVENVVKPINVVIDALASAIEWVEKLIKALAKLNIAEGAKSLGSSIVSAVTGKRAAGGSVSPGGTYLVGEKGPELFSPAGFGRISPNAAGMGGGSIVINFTGNHFTDQSFAEEVGDRIIRTLKMNTRL